MNSYIVKQGEVCGADSYAITSLLPSAVPLEAQFYPEGVVRAQSNRQGTAFDKQL
jgi:hypothetical protein